MITRRKRIRLLQLGWLVAGALGILLLAGGFQSPAEKVAVVDIPKLVDQSEFGKGNQQTRLVMRTAREKVLEFIDTNRVLTLEQAQKIRDLGLKTVPTAEESAGLETVKAEVIASNKKWQELSTRASLTPEERTLIEEYARRSQTMADVEKRWFQEFSTEMETWDNKQNVAAIEKARGAIAEAAKAQGFGLVFEVSVAPYGANDLTAAALQAMNGK